MKLFFGEIFPEVKLNDEEQLHIIKVLRMREGEEISVTDGKGNLAKGNVCIEGKKATVKVSEIAEQIAESPPQLHIAISATKNMDRIEFFVEKATEMGINEITFLITDKSERKNLNIERIKKRVIAASKQSLRFHFPKINDTIKLQDFIKKVHSESTFVAHCDSAFERIELKDISIKDHLTFLVGPEGDFSPKEIQLLAENNIKAVSLGKQRLRTETAGIFIAAWNYGNINNGKK